MLDEIILKLKRHKNKAIILVVALVVLDFLIFWQISGEGRTNRDLRIYFLDVGQGDSELVLLPGGVKVLIDGGPPNSRILGNLEKIILPTDRYIDLVMMSHPQLDHFGGLIDVFKRYRVGAFLTNGRKGEAQAFADLEKIIEENSVKTVVLAKNDVIRYENNYFKIISPDKNTLQAKELNDTALVAELTSNNSKTLFTGDIGVNIEEELLKVFNSPIDILKVAHHGSKYSSFGGFLEVLNPKVAVIEVGKNSYGHPTAEVLKRLEGVGSKIFRTDLDGIIELIIDGQTIKVLKNI